MNISTLTAHNSSLFEIDAELEAAFDQLQEEREITGNISDESRDRCAQLFAEPGMKIDRTAAYLIFWGRSDLLWSNILSRVEATNGEAGDNGASDAEPVMAAGAVGDGALAYGDA